LNPFLNTPTVKNVKSEKIKQVLWLGFGDRKGMWWILIVLRRREEQRGDCWDGGASGKLRRTSQELHMIFLNHLDPHLSETHLERPPTTPD